jgi:hypothetical protein
MSRWIGTTSFVVAVALSGVALSGCLSTTPNLITSEDPERDKDLAAVRTVGDVTEVGNAGPLQVSGVGLVTDLEGTGGTLRGGEWRTMLEKDLRQRKVENIGKLLASPNNTLVLVTALIPPGARKHDPIDIQISLPQGSPCTSLRGGYLHPCVLRNTETTKGINPDYDGGNRLLQGHILAVAKGPLLVGFGNPGESAALKEARIWEGGHSLIERPYYFGLKKDDKSAQVANAVAQRINLKFPDDAKKTVRQEFVQRHRHLFLLDDVTDQLNRGAEAGAGGRGEIARPLNPQVVNVCVPYAYRYNPERYLRVARLIPLHEKPEQQARYRARLQKMLRDPHDAIRAALRLEALGKESVAALKLGLDSDHALVRFASAEALTYLGEPMGAEELARAALTQPNVRAYALIALAGLDEGVCRTKLQELLNTDDAELRAGAFQALRLAYGQMARSEQEMAAAMARLGGDSLGSFWVYRVAPNSQRAVNFAVAKRPEIILFGDGIVLTTPVSVRAGVDFAVTAEAGAAECQVSRINVRGEQRQSCALRLDEVLKTLAELGGQYPEAVDLLRNLDEKGGLNCPVGRLTPPQAMPLAELLAETRGQGVPARSPGGE